MSRSQRGVLPVHPYGHAAGRTVEAWTTATRSASSSTSRRAKISPGAGRACPPAAGAACPACAASEVAALAGVSADYYAKLETRQPRRRLPRRARRHRPRPAARRRRARPPAEPRPRRPTAPTPSPAPGAAPPSGRRTAACSGSWTPITAGPAFVRNGRMDLLAANQLARAFYDDVYATTPGASDRQPRPLPVPRPRARDASTPTGTRPPTTRRHPAHRSRPDPHDKGLHDLVGELSTRSDDFRTRWGAHNVPPARHRHQTLPPPASSATSPSPTKPGDARRPRPHPDHLHRRTRHRHRGGARLLASWAATEPVDRRPPATISTPRGGTHALSHSRTRDCRSRRDRLSAAMGMSQATARPRHRDEMIAVLRGAVERGDHLLRHRRGLWPVRQRGARRRGARSRVRDQVVIATKFGWNIARRPLQRPRQPARDIRRGGRRVAAAAAAST